MNAKGQFFGIILGLVLLLGIGALFFSTASVPTGHVGVQDTFGSVSNEFLQPGFHLKSPFTDVVPVSAQTQPYPAEARAASADLQDVSTSVTVIYHLDSGKILDIYKNYTLHYSDRIIAPSVQESVKAVTARFTAAELITERPVVKQQLEQLLSDKLVKYGIVIESVSITNFNFSESFNAAIEAKVTAEQRALEAKNQLEQIKIEKEQAITRAQAEAESIRLKADAEAYSLKVIQEQLEKAKDLVAYKTVEQWDGKLPVYAMGNAMPLIQLPQGGN